MPGETAARPTGITLHLAPEDVWLAHDDTAEYQPEGFASEGFVHCTDGDDLVLDVANRYYRTDHRSFVLLDVNLARVGAPVLYEDEARRYPHIYGPIERAAVRRVRRVTRAADGTFTGISGVHPDRTS